MTSIEQVFEELNCPSASRLKRVLDTRNIPYNTRELERLVRGKTTRQVQAPRYKFDGKIAASRLHSRWFAGLIDFSAAPSVGTGNDVGLRPTSDGERYILVIQDVFSRKIWTEALLDKRPATVAAAFQTILSKAGAVPTALTSDQGAEFSGEFRDLLETKGIVPRQKDKDDVNAIATLDTAIGNLKKALARVARKQRTNDWASLLQKVTDGHNKLPNDGEYLNGVAPDEVADDDDIKAKLRDKNAEYAQFNKERMQKRAAKLEDVGRFRAMSSRGGAFTRGFKPRYEGALRQAAEVKGPRVADESGNTFLTKFVQPVREATDDAGPVRIEQRGSAQTREKQIRILQPFADGLARVLEMGRPVTAMRALALLQSVRGAAAFKMAVLEARLNNKRKIKNFVDLFPDMFRSEIRNSTLFVTLAAPQVSAASSSSSMVPMEVAARPAAQRLVLNDQGRMLLV